MAEQGYQDMRQPDALQQSDEEKNTVAKKKRSIVREIFSWVEIVIAAFILSYFLTHVVLLNAEVPSESMENLIEPGDRLFGFRLSYLLVEPERGDVIIFKYPVDEQQNFIKRVIGLPGETVEIKEGKIYIDGSDIPLKEDYLPEEWVVDNDGYEFEVPKDCYFVLGDNRNISLDARFWAREAMQNGLAATEQEAEKYTFVAKNKILGKAIFKYYPKLQSLTGGTP